MMAAWSNDDLDTIAKADDLHISPYRDDGVTYGTPTWIWSVAVDDALYVRGYNGPQSRWYQAAVRQKAGRIVAAGITKEETFEPVAGPINDRIDDAYRAKYRGSSYLNPMIGPGARAATVKILPVTSVPDHGASSTHARSDPISSRLLPDRVCPWMRALTRNVRLARCSTLNGLGIAQDPAPG
jgi:hypothetical protein